MEDLNGKVVALKPDEPTPMPVQPVISKEFIEINSHMLNRLEPEWSGDVPKWAKTHYKKQQLIFIAHMVFGIGDESGTDADSLPPHLYQMFTIQLLPSQGSMIYSPKVYALPGTKPPEGLLENSVLPVQAIALRPDGTATVLPVYDIAYKENQEMHGSCTASIDGPYVAVILRTVTRAIIKVPDKINAQETIHLGQDLRIIYAEFLEGPAVGTASISLKPEKATEEPPKEHKIIGKR